jgi:flagellar basal body-associated protein FliL
MKSKLKFILPVLLLLAGAAWKFNPLASEPVQAKPKVEGEVYVLGKQFLINLADGKFAQLTVGLVLEHGETSAGEAAHGEAAAKPPEGFGVMPQEAVVRDVITDELTGKDADDLVDEKSRSRIKAEIASALKQHTDVHVDDVLFTDVTVQ